MGNGTFMRIGRLIAVQASNCVSALIIFPVIIVLSMFVTFRASGLTAAAQTATLEPQSHLPIVVRQRSDVFYVSKTGDNSTGMSWDQAWNELDQIDWNVINPGDTILLDGGSTEMVYTSTLDVGASGTSESPITIRLATRPGRNGRVVIFGGRSAPLPYCGQTGYSYDPTTARREGIKIDNHSWVVIEGRMWGGIAIYGHSRRGIRFLNDPRHITVRNVEIYDNGRARERSGQWDPDGPGVDLAGTNVIFERSIIHDNGQDAFQSGGIGGNFVLRRSWLYNSRPHPNFPNEPFNYCKHSDGIQIYDGGNQYGVTVEDSILGPGFMQGLILGYLGEPFLATIHDVTVRNSLIVHHHGDSSNAALLNNDAGPTNYSVDHVTAVLDPGASWHNMWIYGSGHKLNDSVFYGGTDLIVDGNPTIDNNVCWQVLDINTVCEITADPQFVDNDFSGVGPGFADFDFTIQNSEIPQGTGSSITSVAQLLGRSTWSFGRPLPLLLRRAHSPRSNKR